MRPSSRTLLLIFVAFTTAVVTTITTLYGQSRVSDKAAPPVNQPQSTGQDDRVPVVDFDSPEQDDPLGPERRRKRNARHDKDYLLNKADGSGNSVALTLVSEWDLGLSPLPAAQSEVILVGEVTGGRAHLSNDKTGIYSEFPVTIEEVLKNASSSTLKPGSKVYLERLGGVVRYPNGRKYPYRVAGQDMPGVGLRYVFFLKPVGVEEAYEIITAYELRGDKVFPLDSTDQFDAYKDMEQVKFLEQLKNAVGRQ